MKLNFSIVAIFLLVFLSCNQVDTTKQIDEGIIKGLTYTSSELGWSIEIPNDWKLISKDKLEENDKKGKSIIEKSLGQEVDIKALKHLISFQKDKFNIFASTSEPFKEDFPGEYDQNNIALKEIIYNAFTDQGIKVDTASGKETIQGFEFNTFYTTIYAPDGKVILKQIMYSQLINGYDFGVTINYNNDKDKRIMLDAWEKSIFTANK